MASIVLTAATSAAGSFFGAPVSPLAGATLRAFNNVFGSRIDNAIFGRRGIRSEGTRLKDLSVQTSTYGAAIPKVYGTARIAGNVIWAKPIKETSSTTSSGGGKGGGGSRQTQTQYSYFVTLAIAICEGEIDDVLRVWADARGINPVEVTLSYRLYKGSETQAPDSLIEAEQGVGNTPAFRGLAYVVIEDFPIGDYGNRIPNFTFEVVKKTQTTVGGDEIVENMIRSIVMIPGSGEFVYDTEIQYKVAGQDIGGNWLQQGERERINLHNQQNKANALVALDQLQATLPNLEWVALVVTWFGDSIDAGDCLILPGVEYKTGAITEPDTWQVGSFSRATAKQITLDGSGSAVYGGTPSDACVLRYINEIKSRGLKVMFYPLFFMDTPNKPWRGRVTGTHTEVSDFFTRTNGYNAFIMHYANLVGSDVDAFIIGSEMIGLTKVQAPDNSFPAVNQLITLLNNVRSAVGSTTKLSYAADWSEYHHTDGGWYNLDPLWASSNLDFIGIDAYFPLTNAPQNGYDLQEVMDGWTSGEGYDFIYTDPARTIQAPIAPEYAWKNIAWWWENTHINPIGGATAWVPESKPIWFTEYGFPSVDGATNQPNVFYDPTSSESFFPRFSRGNIDLRAQRLGLTATELKWQDSTMIPRRFVWTWDARPFPYWPDLLNVWSDGGLWRTGHWVQGKLGLSSLAAIVASLCSEAGLSESDFDSSRLFSLVEGFVLTEQISAREAIEILKQAYFFDSVESDGILKFIPRGNASVESISEEYLVPRIGERAVIPFEIKRQQELELPQKVDVLYYNKTSQYQIGNQHSQRQTTESQELDTLKLPIVMSDQDAKTIADIALYNSWLERNQYRFYLPYEYAILEPTDVIEISVGGILHTVRVTETNYRNSGAIEVNAVAEDVSVYQFINPAGSGSTGTTDIVPPGNTRLEFLDIPALPNDLENQANIRFAASGLESGWRGTVVYRSEDAGINYTEQFSIAEAAAIGNGINIPANVIPNIVDDVSRLQVLLVNGTLSSIDLQGLYNGLNLCVLGDELLQFKTATLLEPNKYELSGLLRGRLGTEFAISSHVAGERFVLLDTRIAKQLMPQALFGLLRSYKPVSVGSTLGQTDAVTFTYNAKALKPYSPVHLSGSRDGALNLTISWVRRTRVGGQWRDGVDVPLSEAFEKYEVEILNGGNVVRTITVQDATTAGYTATQQIADFGAAQSSLSVKLYQLSEIVGRGSAAIASI